MVLDNHHNLKTQQCECIMGLNIKPRNKEHLEYKQRKSYTSRSPGVSKAFVGKIQEAPTARLHEDSGCHISHTEIETSLRCMCCESEPEAWLVP